MNINFRRLNVLTQTFWKPYEKIFTEFADSKKLDENESSVVGFSGDVKYHLGTSYEKYYEEFEMARQVVTYLINNFAPFTCCNPIG